VSRENTEQGPEIVAQLGAPSNHLGTLDGKALAQAFSQDLKAAGLFQDAHFVADREDLRDETVLTGGTILEASLRRHSDGQARYVLSVELTASLSAIGELPQRQFWQDSFTREERAAGGSEADELAALVHAVYEDAVSDLDKALQIEALRPPSGANTPAADAAPVDTQP
jgi:hypothetical protein